MSRWIEDKNIMKKLHLSATSAVVLLALTACGNGPDQADASASATASAPESSTATVSTTPSASASPSSNLPAPVTGEPISAKEAVDKATAAAEAYWAVDDLVMTEEGGNPERLAPYAVGTALQDSYDFAEQVNKLKDGTEYHRELEVLDSWTAPRGQPVNGEMKTVDHGSVGLSICNNASQSVYKDPRSEPVLKRTTGSVEVMYSPTDDSWKVSRAEAGTAESQEC